MTIEECKREVIEQMDEVCMEVEYNLNKYWRMHGNSKHQSNEYYEYISSFLNSLDGWWSFILGAYPKKDIYLYINNNRNIANFRVPELIDAVKEIWIDYHRDPYYHSTYMHLCDCLSVYELSNILKVKSSKVIVFENWSNSILLKTDTGFHWVPLISFLYNEINQYIVDVNGKVASECYENNLGSIIHGYCLDINTNDFIVNRKSYPDFNKTKTYEQWNLANASRILTSKYTPFKSKGGYSFDDKKCIICTTEEYNKDALFKYDKNNIAYELGDELSNMLFSKLWYLRRYDYSRLIMKSLVDK